MQSKLKTSNTSYELLLPHNLAAPLTSGTSFTPSPNQDPFRQGPPPEASNTRPSSICISSEPTFTELKKKKKTRGPKKGSSKKGKSPLAKVDFVEMQPGAKLRRISLKSMRSAAGRWAWRPTCPARAAGAPAPAGPVGLQRLEGHGLRHVEVALPCELVQLPRVPHVEVVGQVPQRLHLKKTALLPQKGACASVTECRALHTPTSCQKRSLSKSSAPAAPVRLPPCPAGPGSPCTPN